MKVIRCLICAACAGIVALGLAGCGGPQYVPVSGRLTQNGQPVPKMVVMFQPKQTKENASPGRGSSGITDDDGRFTLKTDDGYTGAAVGACEVVAMSEKGRTPLGEFQVPSGGTDQANFDISPKKK
jgi:hypothetical protein